MKINGMLIACLLAGAAAVTPAVASAQARAPYQTPRTAFGAPDLQGTWTNVTLTRMERPAQYGNRRAMTPAEVAEAEGRANAVVARENQNTDPNASTEDYGGKNCQGAGGRDCGYNAGWKDTTNTVMRVGGEARTSFITSTPDGRMPPRIAPAGGRRTAAQTALEARERQNAEGEGATTVRAGQNDNPEGRSMAERCIAFGNTAGPMTPNGYYNNNIEIVQSRDSVAILLEMVHDVRVVRLNSKHRTDGVRPYFGDSIGWYEGDTLVVETTNYHPTTSYQGASANLTMTERFTRKGAGRLLYQFTVSDPTVWAAPWSGEYEFYPTGGEVYEYACHEGNYGLEGILAGARHEDEERAKAAAAPRPTAAR